MKVDIKINPAFQKIIQEPNQIVFLDANFFIPPDRSNFPHVKPYLFEHFKKNWIIPMLREFPGISIHESVYDEFVDEKIKAFVDEQLNAEPSKIRIFYDIELSESESMMMNHYILKLAVHSKYDPNRDNSKDRGEVKSLSFMAVKNYLFFAANDMLPIRLINEADKLNTGLEDFGIVQMYELIYYLHKTNKYDNKQLKILYKYQYHLSQMDKRLNPEWVDFLEQMDKLYKIDIARYSKQDIKHIKKR